MDVIDAETTNEVRYDGRGKPNTLNTHTNRHRHRHLETYTSGEVFIGDVTAATATDATAFTNNHCVAHGAAGGKCILQDMVVAGRVTHTGHLSVLSPYIQYSSLVASFITDQHDT